MYTATDKELVIAYLAGNPKAFSTIILRHQHRLYPVAYSYGKSEQNALDILQDAFFKASQRLHTYRFEAELSTWLHRIVSNTGYDFAHRRPETTREIALIDNELEAALIEQLTAYDPLCSEVDRMALISVVEELPREQREAFVLVDVYGYSIDWVAQRQSVAPGTVKSRRARARDKLRKQLDSSLNGPRSTPSTPCSTSPA